MEQVGGGSDFNEAIRIFFLQLRVFFSPYFHDMNESKQVGIVLHFFLQFFEAFEGDHKKGKFVNHFYTFRLLQAFN